jgi:hypothetical protein
MRKLLIGLLVLGSFSVFAANEPASTCEDKAREEILNSKTVRTKLVNLLSDSDFTAVEEISDSTLALAKLACKK